MVLVVALLATMGVISPLHMQSAEATYGNQDPPIPAGGYQPAKYLNLINWLDWSQVADQIDGYDPTKANSGHITNPNLPITVTSSTRSGTATLETSCTIGKLYNDLLFPNIALNSSWLFLHMPGTYAGDAWDNHYGSMLTGFGTTINKINFDVSCSVEIVRKDGARSPVPIQGLVFSNAEAIDGGESVIITPQEATPGTPVWWHTLEYSTQCSSNTYIDVKSSRAPKHEVIPDLEWDNTLTLRSPDPNCYVANGTSGPFISMFAENASGAHIDIWPNGGNYLALGVVIGVDAGDAASSYLPAHAIVQPKVEGGTLVPGQSGLNASFAELATVNIDDVTPRLGVAGVDLDSRLLSQASWDTFSGDDSTGREPDDEDALVKSPMIPIVVGRDYSLTVTCQPSTTAGATTYVGGWIDWNADGSFQTDEKSLSTCDAASKTATLTWDTPAQQAPETAGVYKSAIRLVATTDPIILQSGFDATIFHDGEVEDYGATLVTPGVTVTKSIVDAAGAATSVNPAGWTLLATSPAGTKGVLANDQETDTAQQTTSTSGTVQWRTNFSSSDQADPLPVVGTAAALNPFNFSVLEQQQTGYRIYPQKTGTKWANAQCSALPKPSGWSDLDPQGQPIFPWPSSAIAVNNYSSAVSPDGFTIPRITPLSVVNCALSNQPIGAISVTPKLDTSRLTAEQRAAFTADPTLSFSGTYQCIPPADGPFAGTRVSGTWGPVRAGDTWVSDSVRDPIPLGSSCVVKQTAVTNASASTNASPMVGSALYTWAPAEYVPAAAGASTVESTVVATNKTVLRQPIPVATVSEIVQLHPVVQLAFNKVDGIQQRLGGAKFRLVGGPAGAPLDITFADSEDSTAAANALDKNSQGGAFLLTGIPAGTYSLTELQAPAGFVTLSQPITFTITEADVANLNGTTGNGTGVYRLADVVNHRSGAAGLPALPVSGGVGTFLFTLAGALLGLVAAVCGSAAVRARLIGFAARGRGARQMK